MPDLWSIIVIIVQSVLVVPKLNARGAVMDTFFRKLDLKNVLLAAWRDQLPQIRRTLLISLAVGFGGVLAVYILSRFMEVPPGTLTRDPAAITGSSPYVGMLSNLGVMAWAATTAICFFAAALLAGGKRFGKSALFMLASGCLSLMLTIDDAFMLHEDLLPRLHLPEKALYLAYLFFLIGYGIYFFYRILSTDYLLLASAILFLGISVVADHIFPFSDLEAFLEDAPKFIGIVLWLAYFSRTALKVVQETFSERAAEDV